VTDIIIPIKRLSRAKQRLAAVLDAPARAGLVLAMLQDLLTVVAELDRGRLWLVASDDVVFDIARKFDAVPIRETRTKGYNAAVSTGLAAVWENVNVAVLPGDIPLAEASELAVLIAPADSVKPTIRLAASRDRLGTNGLFLSAGNLIQPGFGPGSFARYRATARAVGTEPVILDLPGLAHDIDTPADLNDFAQSATGGNTHRFLCAGNRDLAIRPGDEQAA
jgi:2-phospho-L-lactate guanylyltransferase